MEEHKKLLRKLKYLSEDNYQEHILREKREELDELILEKSNIKDEAKLTEEEKIMSVIFKYNIFDIEYSVVCKTSDLLRDVFQNKIRKEKDALYDYNFYRYYSSEKKQFDPNKSMIENGIYDGDTIELTDLEVNN